MKNKVDYINSFFSELELWEDINEGKKHKSTIQRTVLSFLNDCSMENAIAVYESFFEAYWIGTQNESNPFIDLIRKMNLYERNAGRLLQKQRDHFVHSAFVFILGLQIFTQNEPYQSIVTHSLLDKTIYKDCYDTKYEEFFYRWGIASLFHDIAYPLEITVKQVKTYVDFISNNPKAVSSSNLRVKMEIMNIKDFNYLPTLEPSTEYLDEFKKKYPLYFERNLFDAIDILAFKLEDSLKVKYDTVKEHLENFSSKMNDEGFIDHGYYSALIILRWYYYLIENSNWNPAYFYYPIVDSASAILLHNYYRHGLMNPPFNLKLLKPQDHPIAFLLILCDELQDWNRTGYGETDRHLFTPTDFDLSISNDRLDITYFETEEVNKNGTDLNKKLSTINQTLATGEIFSSGIVLKNQRS
jgi:hypothetical protein